MIFLANFLLSYQRFIRKSNVTFNELRSKHETKSKHSEFEIHDIPKDARRAAEEKIAVRLRVTTRLLSKRSVAQCAWFFYAFL